MRAIEARLCFLQSTFNLFSSLFSTVENMVPQFKNASLFVDQILSYMSLITDTISLGTQPPQNQSDCKFFIYFKNLSFEFIYSQLLMAFIF